VSDIRSKDYGSEGASREQEVAAAGSKKGKVFAVTLTGVHAHHLVQPSGGEPCVRAE
jgi:hypothetical protein